MSLLKSRAALVLSFAIGFLSAYVLFCYYSRPFRYYARIAFGFSPNSSFYIMIISAIAFILAVAVFTISGLHYSLTTASETWRRVNKFDYIITSLFYFSIFFVCAALLVSDPNIFSMAVCPLFGYSSFMLWYMATIYRSRSGIFMKTMRWYLFFRIFKPYRLTGFSAAFFAAVCCVMLSYGVAAELAPVIALSFVGFLLLTYLAELAIQLHIIKAGLTSGRDLDDESEFLAQLQPVVKELSSFSHSYDDALREKIKSERFKTELITNVSHDIKTPLTSIINYIDLLKKLEITDTSFKEYTLVLDKKSQRLRLLIEDLMEAAKAGTGNVAVNFAPINLSELLGQLAGELDEKLAARNLQLIFRLPETDCVINADGKHLWRVMENIFGNAVKYSLPGTRVYAEITPGTGGYSFSLKNVSREPLPDNPDKLAQQFVRGDEARRSEGSGLGLYIAKSLAEIMGFSFNINVSGDMFEVSIETGALDSVDSAARE